MEHRFDTFEIDELKRELRGDKRVLQLQPRVFDLLVYLARSRDRVVPKDELLDAVWPGVIVAEGSLQRAVSLARAALAEAGAPDAIRTFPRKGYRLCADEACRDAKAALENQDDLSGLDAGELQERAHAVQFAGRSDDAIAPLERAAGAFTVRGDRRLAAWAAILLAQIRLEWREPILANGWYHRAARLLEKEPACREKGYLDLLGGRMAFLQNELETALRLGESARKAGRRFHDPDLESVGMLFAGEASLHLGRIREGLAALDEAGASVVADDLSAWAGGLVYCGVIYSCMTRADWHRAGQWTAQFTRWNLQKGFTAYPGLCRLHRAEVLAVRGDLRDAERELEAALEMLATRAPWAESEAWRVSGDILLARGDFAGARAAFLRAAELGWDTEFEMASLHLAEGDARAAARLLARAIADNAWSCRSKRGRALAHYCIAAAESGDVAEARAALDGIERDPEVASTPALEALVTCARGELAAAEGRGPEAIAHLRSAVRAWLAIEAPLAAAQNRCRLAHFLTAENDHESARIERAAAALAFQQAGADGWLARCESPDAKARSRNVRRR
ncbi:MAG: winged helix-turn-helix domain-containing protein [Terrimicrobiaceae bacterium]|nr:winged helix-turn-helix domain-containing protein [Terrimicrobiaceae bacterium]